MSERIKIILDTDIGDDIDDSFALLLSVYSQKFEILGITTVFRNAYKRAKMTKYLLDKMGVDIKVYAGEDDPLMQDVNQIIPEDIKAKETLDEYGKYSIPQWTNEMNNSVIEEQNAVDFIIETIHKYPNEVTIVPIGPLTNIAKALTKDPSLYELIKEIRIMGGGYNIDFSEWNILCDPEAADIVYKFKNLYAVGINVTMKTALDNQTLDCIKNDDSNVLSIIKTMLDKWFKHYEFTTPVMHDPLCIASLIDDKILQFEDMPMRIDLTKQRGRTLVDDNVDNKIHVAMSIDNNKFKKVFLNTILKKEVII